MRSCFGDGARFVLLFVLVLSGILVSNVPAQRRTPRIPPEVLYRDFDVVPTSYDAGGFRLNPKWGKQAREGDNALPSPTDSCPIDDADTLHWTSSPQWPNCRSNPVSFNWSFWCSRHVNLEVVSYEGTVRWGGTGQADWFPAGDSDYELNIERPDQALYSTAGRQIHLEFDSRETVDQWDNTDAWWKQFHEHVAAGDSRHVHDIDNHYAYVIGQLGLDTYQGPGHAASGHGKTELHPVYAMFVLLDQDQRRKQARWAFFIRNWGNEGYCGERQVPLYQQLITVQLRDATAVLSPYAWHGARNADASELSSMSIGVRSTPAGIDLDFGLLTPDRQSWIMGDLLVQQRLPVQELTRGNDARALIPSGPAEKPPSQFAAIQAEIDKLPEQARKELLARQRSVVFRKPGTRLALTTLPAGAARREPGAAATEPLVRTTEDPIGAMNRRRAGEALKAFLETRGVRINLPPER
jgi:hypothetical protein